ncbi:MAG: helix-turn-helix transcriptional regulator [Alphaproteobacteria bacterium]|nr:helix-turn-helix transcriptional regulator [Alphaproteobacteria bacterium]
MGLFGLILVFVIGDVVHDASLGAELEHLLVEFGLMAVAMVGAVMFWKMWRRERATSRAQIAAAHQEVRAWQSEADTWRREARDTLRGLSVAIDRQFDRWELSPAEREVAMLLLKGLSHKEVADVREVSERTARKQARAVYKKAGLAGRAELSAFFLEDLLVGEGG